jgi:hypothetical protein
MANGKYILELAEHIPIRNINFVLDACGAMSAVNQREPGDHDMGDPQLMVGQIIDQELASQPKEAIDLLLSSNGTTAGIKSIGRMILSNLRLNRFHAQSVSYASFPSVFLIYVVVEDLKLHGQGPCYTLVDKFAKELGHQEIIPQKNQVSAIPSLLDQFIHEDMAAIFLGYSLLHAGTLHPLVPFPSNKTGFVARLFHDVNMLLPSLFEAVR